MSVSGSPGFGVLRRGGLRRHALTRRPWALAGRPPQLLGAWQGGEQHWLASPPPSETVANRESECRARWIIRRHPPAGLVRALMQRFAAPPAGLISRPRPLAVGLAGGSDGLRAWRLALDEPDPLVFRRGE